MGHLYKASLLAQLRAASVLLRGFFVSASARFAFSYVYVGYGEIKGRTGVENTHKATMFMSGMVRSRAAQRRKTHTKRHLTQHCAQTFILPWQNSWT